MKITREQVEHVARLARLGLSDEEREMMRAQLDAILTYIDKLNELDTSKVNPTSHVIPMTNVFREDAVTSCLSQDEALANAPECEGVLFRVPRILEE